MKEYITQDRQSLLDIALILFGDVVAVSVVAEANDMALTDELPAGTVVLYDTNAIASVTRVTEPYRINGYVPATATTAMEDITGGVDFMGVEVDFLIR